MFMFCYDFDAFELALHCLCVRAFLPPDLALTTCGEKFNDQQRRRLEETRRERLQKSRKTQRDLEKAKKKNAQAISSPPQIKNHLPIVFVNVFGIFEYFFFQFVWISVLVRILTSVGHSSKNSDTVYLPQFTLPQETLVRGITPITLPYPGLTRVLSHDPEQYKYGPRTNERPRLFQALAFRVPDLSRADIYPTIAIFIFVPKRPCPLPY